MQVVFFLQQIGSEVLPKYLLVPTNEELKIWRQQVPSLNVSI